MAGKTQGDLGPPDPGKVVGGGLEKSPTEDVVDTAGYDPSSSSSSYDGSSGGSSDYGDSGQGTGSADESTDEDTSAGDTGDEDGTAGEDSEVSQEANSDDDPDGDGWEGGDEPGEDETGEDATGEDGTGDDAGDGEMWTQPDEHRTGDEDNQDHGNGWVSIDIQSMTTLIAAMERARDQIPEYEAEFQRILSDVNLIQAFQTLVPRTSQLSVVTAWIEQELPGLRRRLALAQELESGDSPYRTQPDSHSRFRKPVAFDERQIPDHAPHESAEHGRESALLFTGLPDTTVLNELIAKLRGNAHDPYFAHEFTGSADPEAVAAAVEQVQSQPDVDPDRVDELHNLIESTVRTARRGTGELAPAEDFDEQWSQFAESAAQPAETSA